MSIVKREGLGRPMTWPELDGNFAAVQSLTDQASVSASAASTQAQAAGVFADNAAASAASVDAKFQIRPGLIDPPASNADVPSVGMPNGEGALNAQAVALVGRLKTLDNKINCRTVISILEYGTSSQASAALESAINALPNDGGIIYIPGTFANYNFASTVTITKHNVCVIVDPDVTLDFSSIANGNGIYAYGSIDPEINIGANVTTGSTIITTSLPHGLSVGDWFLLKSQRAALHDDAGVDWRLGETTANTTSTFFAEPCQVKSITNSTTVVISSPIIFPNYRTDNSQETYSQSRPSSTIAKINFLKGFKWVGGNNTKSRNLTTFKTLWCYEPQIEIGEADLGSAYKPAVLVENCLRARVKARARHDPGLVWGSDGYEYNSFREIGSWWSNWETVDTYGMQGLDITFVSGGHPSIQPEITATGYDQAQQAMTFHSGSYGGNVNKLRAIRCQSYGIYNRSRFTTINDVVATNCAAAVALEAWGGINGSVRNVHVEGCTDGILALRTGAVADGPAYRDITIDNIKTVRCVRGVRLRGTNSGAATAELSGIKVSNVSGDATSTNLVLVDPYVNGVVVDGVGCGGLVGTGKIAVSLSANSVQNEIRRITGTNIGTGNTLIDVRGIADTTTFPVASYPSSLTVIDTDSCKLIGTGTLSTVTTLYIKTVAGNYTFMSDDARGRCVAANSTPAMTMTIPPDIFILGSKIEVVVVGAGQVTIAAGVGVTLQTLNGLKSSARYARIVLTQWTTNTWIVSGNTAP